MCGVLAGLQALCPYIAVRPLDPAVANLVVGAAAEGVALGVRGEFARFASAAVATGVAAA